MTYYFGPAERCLGYNYGILINCLRGRALLTFHFSNTNLPSPSPLLLCFLTYLPTLRARHWGSRMEKNAARVGNISYSGSATKGTLSGKAMLLNRTLLLASSLPTWRTLLLHHPPSYSPINSPTTPTLQPASSPPYCPLRGWTGSWPTHFKDNRTHSFRQVSEKPLKGHFRSFDRHFRHMLGICIHRISFHS